MKNQETHVKQVSEKIKSSEEVNSIISEILYGENIAINKRILNLKYDDKLVERALDYCVEADYIAEVFNGIYERKEKDQYTYPLIQKTIEEKKEEFHAPMLYKSLKKCNREIFFAVIDKLRTEGALEYNPMTVSYKTKRV